MAKEAKKDPQELTVEQLSLIHIFKELRGVELTEPFQRMPWADAMKYYGSDKPDLRLSLIHIWLLFEKNIGAYICIYEVALSRGELYTVLTNKEAHGGKGLSLIHILPMDVAKLANWICSDMMPRPLIISVPLAE